MAKCYVTGKKPLFGNKVSHSHRRSAKVFKPNMKRVKIIENGTVKRVWVSARALRSGMVKRA